ncbi:hypothetical protein LJC46_04175 [Desulfovibrio sp. OttesenSCG-928-G15]|nr:hypothetical protein [Desulfovibrio sp. OttesenSCG-928-G15]
MSQVESSGGAEAVDTSTAQAAGGNEAADSKNSELGASYLTQEDGSEGDPGDADGQEKAPAESEKEADPLTSVPEKPEDYQIAFAEGVSVDEKLLSGFKAKAHELGIPQGQAQKLAEFYAQNEAARSEAQFSAVAEMKRDWEEQIMSSPSFRKDASDARKTLVTFGSFGAVNEKGEPAIHPEIKSIFDESLVGSHPKVFQMFVDIGKALAEPEARGRGVGGGKEKPLADRLWPDMK